MEINSSVNSSLRERVFQTLDFVEPDICPYYIWIDPEMEKPPAEYYHDPHLRRTIIQNHVVMAEVRALLHPLENAVALIDRFVNQETT